MTSPQYNDVRIPFPPPPHFRFAKLFRRQSELNYIYGPLQSNVHENYKRAPQLLDQTIPAICGAIDRILSHETIPGNLSPEIEDFKQRYHAFCKYIPVIFTLGLTSDEWIGKYTQRTLITVVSLLHPLIMHFICLLHPRWLYIQPSKLSLAHILLNHHVPAILKIDIPWHEPQDARKANFDIKLTGEQWMDCTRVFRQPGFDDLPVVFVAFEKQNKWKTLRWQKRYDNLLRQRFTQIGLLLEKAAAICERPQWEMLMFPLPSRLATQWEEITDLRARADFHIRWIKPETLLCVLRSFKSSNGNFELGDATPGWYPRGDTGRWLIESEQYQSWLNSAPGTNQRYLWCLGKLGMGKSVLVYAITNIHRRDWWTRPKWLRPIIVQLHFSYRPMYSPDRVLWAILKQVISQIAQPTNSVASMYEALIENPNTRHDIKTVTAALQELVKVQTIHFFLDGLDACEPDVVEGTIRGFLSLDPKCRVICFSRPTSFITPEAYPEFTFMDIELHRSDLELCLSEVASSISLPPEHPFFSQDTRSTIIDQVMDNSQGTFLLLDAQIKDMNNRAVKWDLFDRLTEICSTALSRFFPTMWRISEAPSGKDVRNLIAWVAVRKTLSISKDIPHLQSQFTAPNMSSIRYLILESLGMLHITDGDKVAFTSNLAEIYVTTDFSKLFPTFVSDVESSLLSPPMSYLPEDMRESFTQFVGFLASNRRHITRPPSPISEVLETAIE